MAFCGSVCCAEIYTCLCIYTCIHMCTCIHSFHKHLLSTYCVPGTVTGNREIRVSKGDMLFLFMGSTVWHICACVCTCECVFV